MRTVLNGRGEPVVLTPENCTTNGANWSDRGWLRWDDIAWHTARFDAHPNDPRIVVSSEPFGIECRIRGKRWKITGLLP